MEDLIVNSKEHKLLRKFKKKLEQRYNVAIRMPSASSLDSDVIFVSIHGEKSNRDCVKNFLSERKNKSPPIVVDKGVVLITLSDSEEEESSVGSEEAALMETSSSDSSSTFGSTLNFRNYRDDSVCIIETSLNKGETSNISDHQTKGKKRRWRRKQVQSEKVRSKVVVPSADADSSELFDDRVRKQAKLNESVIILEDLITQIDSAVDCSHLQEENNSVKQESESSKKDTLKATPAMVQSNTDFIPLFTMSESRNRMREDNAKGSDFNSLKQKKVDNDDIVVIDEPELAPRSLRPIVIDGSNVAYEHGKVSHSFSVKGIQIAIDYFLKRGHTQVTAFVPKFRKSSNPNRYVPSTDVSIFDELEKKQLVVFTPSRRLNGKNIASYDDRFIVQLAASNGGVIVSNDNYRDLIDENDSYKEAIEQRLLMFCFVGDVFMVPDDPLGRNGPKLIDYLSFPPDSKKDES